MSLVAQANTSRTEPASLARPPFSRGRGIIDLSGTKLIDRPSFVEEKLLKTGGIISAEINVYSNRMIVEFDPSVISLERIKMIIRATSAT